MNLVGCFSLQLDRQLIIVKIEIITDFGEVWVTCVLYIFDISIKVKNLHNSHE